MYRKYIALILACLLLFSACSKKTESSQQKDNNDLSLSEEGSEVDAFSGLDDPDLERYIEDNIFANLEYELDLNEYVIDNVNAIYIPEDQIDALESNPEEPVFFGNSIDEVDDQFADSKYICIPDSNETTDVQSLDVFTDETVNEMIKNVAIGSGVILICITISVISGGLDVPAISTIFAASAEKAAVFAASSSAFSGISAAIVKGYQSNDFIKALKAGAVSASKGFKWGAIFGCLYGGAEKLFAIRTGGKIVPPRQSELDVLKKYKGAREQISYLNGEEVIRRTEGAVRPDVITEAGEAIEVKNYDLQDNFSLLKKVLRKEIGDRVINLPKEMKQKIILDVRGRGYSKQFLQKRVKELQESLFEICPNIPIELLAA